MAFTSDPQTVEDLLPPPALDDVKAFLLAYLSVPQNRLDDWESGSALRTMHEMESAIIRDLVGSSLAQLVSNGYPDSASGKSLEKLALGWFDVAKVLPTLATQNVTLACDATHGPYSSAQILAQAALTTDGARYLMTTGGALTSGSTVSVVFTAESPGAARAMIAALDPGLPGVTVQAAAIAGFGSDGDDDVSILAKIDERFGDLGEVPTEDRLITWARAAAPAPLLTRFRLDADPDFPGGVLMTLANAGGPVAGGTVTAVQTAFDELSPITDVNTAQNSTSHTINASGTVSVKAALLARAQAAADAAWAAALATAQIGGTFFLQTLREIVGAAIRTDPGSNFTDAALAGAGGDGNVTLSATEVPVAGDTLTNQLTWVPT